MAAITPWMEAYRIHSYEVGPDGSATLPALCNYLQDAAGQHARELGVSADQLADQHLTWFLARLRVRINRWPAWRELVRVETWPSGHDGVRATREFIVHGDDGQVGVGSSAWLMVNLERRRPVRLPELVTSFEVPQRPRPLAVGSQRPDLPDAAPLTSHFTVRRDDLDLNGHVNNVVYVTWIEETLAASSVAVPPSEIEVHFRAEATYGDRVRVESGHDVARDAFVHRLLRTDDDRELARARTAG